MQTQEKQKSSFMHKVFTVIGAIMCVVLIPMLAVNLTLIVKSFINPSEVPDIGGYFPMIVLTESMADKSQQMNILKETISHTVPKHDTVLSHSHARHMKISHFLQGNTVVYVYF